MSLSCAHAMVWPRQTYDVNIGRIAPLTNAQDLEVRITGLLGIILKQGSCVQSYGNPGHVSL